MMREVFGGVVIAVFSVLATLALARGESLSRQDVQVMIDRSVDDKFMSIQVELNDLSSELKATKELMQRVQIDVARQGR